MQEALQARGFRPGGYLTYELMFDQKKRLFTRLTDTADLLIDFATLGEYGLEPVDQPSCRTEAECQTGRHRRPGVATGEISLSLR